MQHLRIIPRPFAPPAPLPPPPPAPPRPFFAQVLHAQTAGALALVIVDNGPCDGGLGAHTCVHGALRTKGHGWGRQDDPGVWRRLRLPALIVQRQEWQRVAAGWPQLALGQQRQEQEDGTGGARGESVLA